MSMTHSVSFPHFLVKCWKGSVSLTCNLFISIQSHLPNLICLPTQAQNINRFCWSYSNILAIKLNVENVGPSFHLSDAYNIVDHLFSILYALGFSIQSWISLPFLYIFCLPVRLLNFCEMKYLCFPGISIL